MEALSFLETHPVDLVFLDVQMPGLDGLGVADVLLREGGPAFIFVTAFSEHAIKAFELDAIDYLLKPGDRERFHAAVERARTRLGAGRRDELADRLAAVLAARARAGLRGARAGEERRPDPVRGGGDMDWVEAADNYVRLHTGAQRHLVRETIRSVEARLDPARFARSAIIKLSGIRELQPTFNGEYAVLLTTGARLTLSRTYRDAVRARLGGVL